jgi:hypothetical protein
MHHLKALLLVSLLLTSQLTQAAQWTAIGLFDIGNITHAGEHHKAWTMLDYREPKVHAPTGKNFKSTRMQMEFNCKEQTVRTLSLSYHTGVRLSGDTLSTEGVIGPFEPVPPETPIFKIMRLVC